MPHLNIRPTFLFFHLRLLCCFKLCLKIGWGLRGSTVYLDFFFFTYQLKKSLHVD